MRIGGARDGWIWAGVAWASLGPPSACTSVAPSDTASPERPSASIHSSPSTAGAPARRAAPPPASVTSRRPDGTSLAGATDTGAPMPLPAPSTGAAVANDLSTGVIVFDGLTADQLESIRVIPEEGTSLFRPANKEYTGVDGFWWRGDRRWFKIPGGTHVHVRPEGAGPAANPAANPAATTLSVNGMVLEIASSPASLLYRQLKGPAAAAGWQPDTGASAHSTDSPF